MFFSKIKYSFSALLVIFVCVLCTAQQPPLPPTNQGNQDTQQTQQTQPTEDFSYLFTDATDTQGAVQKTTTQKAPSAIFAFVKMIVVLLVVLGCIYAVFFFVKKNTPTLTSDDLFLRRVASISVGQGKSVQVITLLDNAFVIGVSEQNINLLGKIEDKELIQSLNLNYDRTTATTKPKNFSDVLNIFLKKANTNGFFDQSAQSATESMQKVTEQAQTDTDTTVQNTNERVQNINEGTNENA